MKAKYIVENVSRNRIGEIEVERGNFLEVSHKVKFEHKGVEFKALALTKEYSIT